MAYFFITNFNNLMSIISQNLFTPDFSYKKYYKDISENKNFLPVFKNDFNQAIKSATSEKGSVELAFIEMDLNGEDCMMKLKYPVPISMIKSIIFENEEKIEKFVSGCKLYGNINLNGLKLKTNKTKFRLKKQNTLDFEIENENFEIFDKKTYDLANSFGGALLNLWNLKTKISSKQFEALYDKNANLDDFDIVFKEFHKFIYGKKTNIFYEMVFSNLIKTNYKDEIINGFDELLNKVFDREKDRINEIKSHILELYFNKNINKTSKDIITSSKKNFEKILLTLFWRDDFDSVDKSIFDENELALTSMIYGFKSGYRAFKKELKNDKFINDFISVKMANFILKETFYEETEFISINKMFNDDKFKTKLLKNKIFIDFVKNDSEIFEIFLKKSNAEYKNLLNIYNRK